MRLCHLAEYFQIQKLRTLVLEARHNHTESMGKQLCRLIRPINDDAFDDEFLPLFAAIEELYGKYSKQGQYAEQSELVMEWFKCDLMQLLVNSVHEIAQMPSFKSLLYKNLVFAADWAFELTEVAGYQGPIAVGNSDWGSKCADCNCEKAEDLIVESLMWIRDGKRELKCNKCFYMPELEDFKA